MKYEKEKYLDSGIYGYAEEDISCYKEKLVKCRKEHECMSCGKTIKIGEHAVCESGFQDGGAVSCYTCTDCIEEWLEDSGQIDE